MKGFEPLALGSRPLILYHPHARTQMASAEDVAVFAETNLGTHIAMAVPTDITAGDFKRHLEKTHASCLPSFGEIQVYGIMVKRKSCFYYIPEPLPIKHIFRDFKAAWFICAEARLVNGSYVPCISNRFDGQRVRDDVSNKDSELDSSVSDIPVEGIIQLNNGGERIIKKSLCKQVPEDINSASLNKMCYKERTSCSLSRMLESKQQSVDKGETFGSVASDPETIPSFSVSDVAEVSNYPDFTSTASHNMNCKDSKVRKFQLLSPNGRSKSTEFVKKRRKSGRVGKKLVVASNNIRMQGRKQVSSSLSSICRGKIIRRLIDGDAEASLTKYLIFEIPDHSEG